MTELRKEEFEIVSDINNLNRKLTNVITSGLYIQDIEKSRKCRNDAYFTVFCIDNYCSAQAPPDNNYEAEVFVNDINNSNNRYDSNMDLNEHGEHD